MKKLLLALSFVALGCSREAGDREGNMNSTSDVEEHSNDNISPQLGNQAGDRFKVDTVSGSGEVNEAKEGELE